MAGSLLRKVSGLSILLLAAGATAPAQTRVVTVGDVHGAFPEFVAILQRTGLTDASRNWTGGSAVLVQTGDVPDRGPATRQSLDLLMELERQAEKQSGKVLPLLGNNEVMTVLADLLYVSVEDYQSFATDQSEKVREQAFEDYKKFLQARGKHNHPLLAGDEGARQKWLADHPLGYFERYDAFSPQGLYGRWLRGHDAVAQVGDVLYMHGGLNPKLHFRNIRELNDRIRSEMANFDSLWQGLANRKLIWRYMTLDEAIREVQDEWAAIQSAGQAGAPSGGEDMQKFLSMQSWLLISQDSPLWYRGLALEPEEKLKHDLDKMLARLKARYLVAAHTVRPKYDIMTRFDNHVFLIDTGMLKPYFGGRASALEIRDGRFAAFYADEEKPRPLFAAETGAQPAAAAGQVDGERKP